MYPQELNVGPTTNSTLSYPAVSALSLVAGRTTPEIEFISFIVAVHKSPTTDFPLWISAGYPGDLSHAETGDMYAALARAYQGLRGVLSSQVTKTKNTVMYEIGESIAGGGTLQYAIFISANTPYSYEIYINLPLWQGAVPSDKSYLNILDQIVASFRFW